MTLIVKKTAEFCRGVFTDRPFQVNDVVLKIKGASLTSDQVASLPVENQYNVLQIGKNNYINMEKELPFFINHSCNPNCYIKAIVNSAFLVALRPIPKGEEITFDYSITSTDSNDEWSIKCSCHRFQCRKTISGFNTLSEKKKEELIKKGVVPRYIKN